ncbi:mycofactocin-coupled SDR family oxidoreductase [Gordonia sp. HNM0687]|uniref:Mycofactocin-coupled SDR family oxidoreductase n=1 Tax=Gordonia mangrovi TaxID=2665643 RepID=A0A6L7GUT8_9ACTN|nr:mycofactocin-coupled SDR family oxidoreductase [Gordonia mangrovi]MXP23343.1 mycofactocin-coupled SDR family oxidoreductase [Gordonia mangrovi]UVF80759.1 mycofactocin-coupled SDR family oxidoreductase [Gordonia mangrovi]
MAQRYVGKVALVTGAARGQGRAVAVRLAAEGADVIAVDICADLPTTQYPGASPEDLAETVRLVEKHGRRIVSSQTDVRDFAGMRSTVEEGLSELGRLDVVVANAGMTTAAPAWEITPENWEASIGVNLTGAFYTAKAAIPAMIEQATGGAIVFVSSTAGLRGLPLLADYVSAKHGVTGLAKVLANELGMHRIRVNSIHPFGVETGLKVAELHPQLEATPAYAPFYQATLPDRISQADDIAAAIAWLASDEARHVTGVQLPVDLGRANR